MLALRISSLFVLLVIAGVVFGDECPLPLGGEIYTKGISDQGKIDVVKIHNSLRQQIMNGTVPGQPRGKNLKTMNYDQKLGEEARVVSNTCQMKHIIASDSRHTWIGQNIFISWSSVKITTQNWTQAVNAWFNERKYFKYPNKSTGITGHYTQVVWATSELLGCDFIAFYDKTRPEYPFARMYTCNYGPGGNIAGEAPYPLA